MPQRAFFRAMFAVARPRVVSATCLFHVGEVEL
jgi:hypothetical protein